MWHLGVCPETTSLPRKGDWVWPRRDNCVRRRGRNQGGLYRPHVYMMDSYPDCEQVRAITRHATTHRLQNQRTLYSRKRPNVALRRIWGGTQYCHCVGGKCEKGNPYNNQRIFDYVEDRATGAEVGPGARDSANKAHRPHIKDAERKPRPRGIL